MKVFGVIMAGGGGTRFWPVSRAKTPKQLLDLSGDGIMINQTVERLEKISPDLIYVVTATDQKDGVINALSGRVKEKDVICEPFAKNTAACIGYAAVRIVKEHGDGIMAVSPSDAFVKDEKGYAKTLKTAVLAAESGALVTIGIKPAFPATGYGYIKCGDGDVVKKVERFVEKPDLKSAESYLKQGMLWNSGVFVFKASAILDEIKVFIPDLYAALIELSDFIGAEDEALAAERAYNKIPSVSIDYGVMEKTDKALVVKGDFGWSDVGSFDALGSMLGNDACGNVIRGDALTVDTKNSVIFSEKSFVATLGVKDVIVAVTDDAVLVCDKSRAQEIKSLVDKLKEQGRKDLI